MVDEAGCAEQKINIRRKGLDADGKDHPGRVVALDGIRLFAALCVVVYHYIAYQYVAFGGGWRTDTKELFPRAFPVAAYGWLGVELFFLISGFVICMSCWGKPVRGFFVSRAVRLFPAYWFGVVATTLVVAVIPGPQKPRPWWDVLTNLTMLQEPLGVQDVDGVYWTLFAELRFYLLFALMCWWGLTYRRVLIFCGAWMAASALCAGAGDGPLRMLVMPECSWYFIAGVAFYLMYRFRPNVLLTGMVLTCFCASLPFAHTTWSHLRTYLGHTVPYWPVVVVVGMWFVLMAFLATGRLSWVTCRWLPVAGALTYPLYLLHECIGWQITHVMGERVPPHVIVPLVVAGMLVVSWFVHRYVERPAGRWLRTRMVQAFAQVKGR
ncbi:acyltransferase [Streptomyces sp. AV19]|uniref:acyltransferase family protein n=1 Tax=Streptomyces sp. AV19 TaxID=2793068 RepID=UPI0018FE5247|nr:acyltransferase [Streptomyces sp. AV19]MBH1937949.1 acyltransferase [Streptomyces sp. AV19]MDG4536888.1 acyltransferase [Streptomyces sp. AV19]